MAASAELLVPSESSIPPQQPRSKRMHESVDLAGVLDPDSGLDGSCTCDCIAAPLTSEPPLADVAPLTSEPPLAEMPLTSEPSGAGFGTEAAEI